MATLTYVYADQTAVLGPLSPEHIPGSYDLCSMHCAQLSAPRGWEVIRLPEISQAPPAPSGDDLLALADAVREVGLRPDEVHPRSVPPQPDSEVVVLAERRHLRMIAGLAKDADSLD